MPPEFDTLIENGIVVTVNRTFDVLESGRICIQNGRIACVEAAADRPRPAAAEVIDADGGIIMPGLVNTHTHAAMTLFRGLADDLPLDIWLREHMFPAEGRFINAANVEIGTTLACAEMLLAGTTTFCDGYFYEDAVAQAVDRVKMRAVLGQGVIDMPAPGVPDPAENIRRAEAFVQKWRGASPLISSAVFCHSPYTCRPHTLAAAKEAAHENGVLFQIHAAETRREARRLPTGSGVSPLRFLDDLGVMDDRTLLVHAVWLEEGDIDLIRRRAAAVSHNPESNMKLAAGVAPVNRLLTAGVPVGLGTDGCASNNDLDLFKEMDTAAKLHKVTHLDPTVMDAATVLKMATIDGARAIGLSPFIGSIEVGKEADIVVLKSRQPHLTPMYHPVSQIVYAAGGGDVRDVLIAGRVVVRNRRLTTIDGRDVMQRARDLSRTIRTFKK